MNQYLVKYHHAGRARQKTVEADGIRSAEDVLRKLVQPDKTSIAPLVIDSVQAVITDHRPQPQSGLFNNSPNSVPQDKATPRPWRFGGTASMEIFSVNAGSSICELNCSPNKFDGEACANAALIVRAVNEYSAHQQLEEAVESLRKASRLAFYKTTTFQQQQAHAEVNIALESTGKALAQIAAIRNGGAK